MADTADVATERLVCLGGVQSVTTNSQHSNDHSDHSAHHAPVGVCSHMSSQTHSCTDSCSKVLAAPQKTNGVVNGAREDAGYALADCCNNRQTTETTDDAAVKHGRETRPVTTAGDLKCTLKSNCNINGATDNDCSCCGDVAPSSTTEQVELSRDVVGQSTVTAGDDVAAQSDNEPCDWTPHTQQQIRQRKIIHQSYIKQGGDDADSCDTSERWEDEVQDFANCNVTVRSTEDKQRIARLKLSTLYADDDERPIRPAKCPDAVPRYEPTPLQVGCVSDPDDRKLRIVHISDTHGDHDKVPIPPGDVLVHSGDFFFYTESNDFDADTKQIDDFFARQPHQYKIFVAGNHEMSFKGHSADEIQSRLPHVIYLQDSPVTIEGLVIYGSPWCGERGSPADAFTIPFDWLRERAWNKIPTNTDLLVTHAAPHRILDNQGDTGCRQLREVIFSAGMKICMHMFGHAHETPKTKVVNGILFSNGVQCYSNYRDCGPNVADFFLPPRRSSHKKHRNTHCNVS